MGSRGFYVPILDVLREGLKKIISILSKSINFCFSDVKFYIFWFSHPWISIRIRLETALAQSITHFPRFFLRCTDLSFKVVDIIWVILTHTHRCRCPVYIYYRWHNMVLRVPVRTAVDYLPRKIFNNSTLLSEKEKFDRIRISESFLVMNPLPEIFFLYIGPFLQVTAFTSTGSVDPTLTSGGSCAKRGRQPQDRERDPADLPCPTCLTGRPSRGSSSRYCVCGLPKPDL